MKSSKKLTEKNTETLTIGTKVNKETLDLVHSMEQKYPNMMTEFEKICLEQFITFVKKQNDYGPANIAMNTHLENEQDLKLSLTGLTVRMNDKMSRLINLILKKNKPQNESIEDTFMDLSVYGKIALIVMRGKWGK